MRRIAAMITLGAVVVGTASAAGATHTGCEHGATARAHATVPHKTEGNHNAHAHIPYCPPHDAPGRR